ncbi:hypothetical protein FHS89_001781 [Rubricella aquisinus]|uniref:Uncharacterized protein n=1 Tax=Rubricella aquisinus TaxID=2028108 RepID=A0A840WMH2_9RHOB|nr:hypothetical protein [Rubricella aquisinus]MBB5515761.1 hypothetical protein [Rubricella aquisinus]
MRLDLDLGGGTRVTSITRQEAEARGIAEATIASAETAIHAAQVSAECRRRIYAVASAETQMNMAAAAAVISAKTASQRSAAEADILTGLEVAIGWVAAMRANVVTLAADPALNITDDANWPSVPPAAVAVAEQF